MAGAWFSVDRVDARTHLISEPRYWQRNNQYLLLGRERALLFDSGSGRRDITPVIRRLTSLPLIVVASHLHYDHIGNHARLARQAGARIAVPDLPDVRAHVRDTGLDVPWAMRLSVGPRRFGVDQWWAPGEIVDLGDRPVKLLRLPGHTADSVGLLDPGHGLALVGDTIYHAPGRYDGIVLAGAIPSASVAGYRRSAAALAAVAPRHRLLAGHYAAEVAAQQVGELIDALGLASRSGWATRPPAWPPFRTFRVGRTRLIVGRGAMSG